MILITYYLVLIDTSYIRSHKHTYGTDLGSPSQWVTYSYTIETNVAISEFVDESRFPYYTDTPSTDTSSRQHSYRVVALNAPSAAPVELHQDLRDGLAAVVDVEAGPPCPLWLGVFSFWLNIVLWLLRWW